MNYAKIFRALGDETRLEIAKMLSDGEMCACKILEKFDITQPTLSHHMKILTDSGLISSRKDSKWTFYLFDVENLAKFKKFIQEFKCCKEACSCC